MALDDKKLLAAVLKWTAEKHGMSVRQKTDSPFMSTIGAILKPFNPGFMRDYWTTIWRVCYAPGPLEPADWRSIGHEGKHAEQSKRIGEPLMSLAYLFPVSLVLLTLPAAVWAFFALPLAWFFALPIALAIFALPLAPWPAHWRQKYEIEAYTVTAALDAFRRVDIRQEGYRQYLARHFSGPAYYFMTWGHDRALQIADQIIADAEKALSGKGDPYLLDLLEVIKNA